MKTKNDYIKLVEDIDLKYKPIYLAFGYKEDIEHDEESKLKIGNKIYSDVKTVVYLKRDSNIKKYNKLVELQKEYFDLAKNKKKPKKINKFLLFILLILGIIPGIIYLISHNKKDYEKINNERMNEILDEAKKLLEE